MNLTVEDVIKKQQTCIEALDDNKNCTTCRNNNTKKCDNCYNELLCLSVNPTNWEG